MSVLAGLSSSIEKGRKAFYSREECEFSRILKSNKKECQNLLGAGDSRDFMKYLLREGYNNKFKAIYIDPPFFSKVKYNTSFAIADNKGKSHRIQMEAYDDRWNNSIDSYLEYITSMVYGIYDLLADDGVVMLHIDWHATHYCRLILDEVFGRNNFVNEIVWTYKSGGAGKKSFARKHDNILIYSKSSNYTYNPSKVKSYNRDYKKYSFKGVKEYEDEKGWYTLVNERDVWFMDMVGRTSKERTGYATQKPMALIEKLVKAFTNEGDLVGDFCAGSGTVAKVCEQIHRKWVCADVNNSAISLIIKSLSNLKSDFTLYAKEKDFFSQVPFVEYRNGDFYGTFQEEQLKVLRKILSKNSLENIFKVGKTGAKNLVNFISIDLNYDGKMHNSDILVEGRDVNLVDVSEKGKTHVIYGDVFGNFIELEE